MSAIEKKSFLFVFENPPHSNLYAKEGFDFSLACAAFDQQVSVLFMEDGVYQLLKNQNTQSIKSKNHSASIEAFELYGIEACYYQTEALVARQLSSENITEQSKALEQSDIALLIAQQDYVLTY